MSIQDKFKSAVNVIKGLPKDGPYQPSNEMALKFYGLYKQATEGPCQIPKPSFYQLVAGYKWQAWNSLGDITKEEAMEKYVAELKKIVETMSYSADVASFMEALGPFYEYVDVPGNNNDTKCIKDRAEPDDTSQEGDDDIAEDTALEGTSNEGLRTNGSEDQQDTGSEKDNKECGVNEVMINSDVPTSLDNHHNEAVPFRNGHLPSQKMGNGVVTKAFFMAAPLTAAEQDFGSQHRHRQEQQQQLQQAASGAKMQDTSDTDSDEEYSEPSESLAFCSGSSGLMPPHSLTKIEAGDQSNAMLANLGVDEKIHVVSSQYLSCSTNVSLVNGNTTDQYIYTNGTTYSTDQPDGRDGHRFDPVTSNARNTTAGAPHTNGYLQDPPFPPGTTDTRPGGACHIMTNTSTGQPVPLVYSEEMVQGMQQIQAELGRLTRYLDVHLSDISRAVSVRREPIAAVQNSNDKELSTRGGDATRHRRRWWPLVPELSRRSAMWLILWPVFVHFAIKLLGAVIAMRRRRNK